MEAFKPYESKFTHRDIPVQVSWCPHDEGRYDMPNQMWWKASVRGQRYGGFFNVSDEAATDRAEWEMWHAATRDDAHVFIDDLLAQDDLS